ncbi:2-dehydropantoate 2-reductase [Agaricicola taiwanensis]|uniref:2-dehydropantoate 2-reductase n=1 Tax=Agaricicola taiwanensis TaxID=591372 RepID=A0A8J2VSN7_9RHOB|nr:2-dehydropantoate 2-reductase [Agaricicola taiwanensis]GGE39367.1 2-dehydropantoate 2-reductase [Agaricicola taiwanensis]
MRIAVFGAGGVGGYFGGRLAASGEDVTFVARGQHLAAMKEKGLLIRSPLGDCMLRDVQAVEDIAEAGPIDLVMIAVKLWSTEEAVEAVRPLAEQGATVVSFQNGIYKDEVLKNRLPPASLMGGVSYISAFIEKPGVISHKGKMQGLSFGKYDGARSSRAEALLAACARAGISAKLSADIERDIWEKFVFLVGLSAVTTAMRQPIGVIRENPQARSFLRDLMQEVVTVGRANGVNLAPDFAENRLIFTDTLPPEMIASMFHDLQTGNRLEVPWLSGSVVEQGRRLGIDTPCNRAVADILAIFADGRPS